MEVDVKIVGATDKVREVLRTSYDLRWDSSRKGYVGKVPLEGHTLKNLLSFAERFNMIPYVNGTKISEPSSYESDDYIESSEYSEDALGVIGTEELPDTKKPGYKEVIVGPDDDYDFEKYQKYFDDTLFKIPRQEQKQLVPLIVKSLKEGYQNIIVECPTGSGKSALSMILPKIYDGNAYITTHLKGLQAQYMNEMPFMRSVMGRANFPCELGVKPGTVNLKIATDALERHKAGLPALEECNADLAPCACVKEFVCPYKNPKHKDGGMDFGVDSETLCGYYSALTEAQNANYFIANNAYAMAIGQSPSMLPQRDFLIIDEAHNLSGSMASFYSLDLSIRSLERLVGVPSIEEILSISVKKKQESLQKKRDRLLAPWRPSGNSFGFPKIPSIKVETSEVIREKGAVVWEVYLKNLLGMVTKKLDSEQYKNQNLKYAHYMKPKLEGVISGLSQDWKNMVWQISDDVQYVSFKCLDIKKYSETLLLRAGKKRIFMSATISEPSLFCDELGLNKDTTIFIRVDYSSFPLANRPVFTNIKGGRLTRDGRTDDDWLETAQAIVKICSTYDGKKGLILPFTDSIEKTVFNEIERIAPSIARRILRHTKDPHGREATIERFKDTKDDSILMSTYANQGFDGRLVDFCIVIKVPFPALGDVRTAKKTKDNPQWYKMETAVELSQMCGRIVRGKTDIGHTYIIDPTFEFHYKKGLGGVPLKDFMPSHLNESIEVHKGTSVVTTQTALL